MKKQQIMHLIKYHYEKNEIAFAHETNEIAKEFYENGDYELSRYISSLVSDVDTFSFQALPEIASKYLKKIKNETNSSTFLPDIILEDIEGIINAINKHTDINKFLFYGQPGTGKTETVKTIANTLKREIYLVQTPLLIDSHLGQTSKNLVELFNEINNISYPSDVIILFDELDAIVQNRVDSNDVKEMSRVLTTFLNELDNLDNKIVLFATTNLHQKIDSAILRRFDFTVDFNRYTKQEIIETALHIFNSITNEMNIVVNKTVKKIFEKIMNLNQELVMPAIIKTKIKTAIAFSEINNEYDYLRKIYKAFLNETPNDLNVLKQQGFSVREIECLTGTTKATVARKLKGEMNEK